MSPTLRMAHCSAREQRCPRESRFGNAWTGLSPWMLLGAALGLLLALPTSALERLEPTQGCYFGVNFADTDTIPRLNARLGLTPAVYARFFEFPLPAYARGSVSNFLAEVTAMGGIAMLTLEPVQGLKAVTTNACIGLGNLCAAAEAQGVGGIFIRFAHEMNGHWYPWGQQPLAYKQAFHLLGTHVHALTTRTALLWAPNNGVGYPFGTNGAYQAQAGTAEFLALDTNGDGVLTESDDMYGPYYPGDDVVDWVGMTIYHWGVDYPWLENELPRARSFGDALTGNSGRLPNFYARYCADGTHNKPLAIPETAAFYNTQQPGPEEFAIKQAWWQQVLNISGDNADAVDVATHFPKLKCVNWFDHYKREREAQNQWIDWRISAHPLIRSAFVSALRTPRNGQPYFLTGQEFQWQQSPYAVTASNLPSLLPLAGTISVSLNVKAQTRCDLVVDLLDQEFHWYGGTRVPVTAGTQTVNANVAPTRLLADGAVYRWSIFLTPTGSNYLNALAWLKTAQPVARAITPLTEIVAAPPVAPPRSNFTVRLRYVSPVSALVQVNLLDGTLTLRGHGSASISQSEGMVEVIVIPQAGLASGDYFLESFLTTSSTNSLSVLAHGERVPILIAELASQDRIMAVPITATVPVGEVFRVALSYAAAGNRELHVDLFDANSNWLASAVQPVSLGSGIRDMVISYPSASPGQYIMRAFVTALQQTSAQMLASSPEVRVSMLALDYQQWIESNWGLVLANDPVDPEQDPDSDGVTNINEFVALTNPRDATSRLKTQLSMTPGQLTVNWPSTVGRSYQLFRTSDLRSNLWSPVGNVMSGTGQSLQVIRNREAATPNEFYRVQVFKP